MQRSVPCAPPKCYLIPASLIFRGALLGAAKKARGSMYSVLIGRQGLASDCADHEPREAGEPHTNIKAGAANLSLQKYGGGVNAV